MSPALTHHALRRDELCRLTVKTSIMSAAVCCTCGWRAFGKGSKTRYVPLHLGASSLAQEHLDADGRAQDADSPPPSAHLGTQRCEPAAGASHLMEFAKSCVATPGLLGISQCGALALRAMAATNVLDH